MRLGDLLIELSRTLSALTEEPRALARTLVAHELNIEPSKLLSYKSDVLLDDSQLKKIRIYQARLLAGEPLAYVLGTVWFFNRLFAVGEGVLIPRPDTEVLVEAALSACADIQFPEILELCTGTACISISVLLELHEQGKSAAIVATDISEDALSFAMVNRAKYNLTEQLDLRLTDLFPPEDDRYNLILSNPPYIDDDDMAHLDPSVDNYEPKLALAGGLDGLDFYRRIYREAVRYLQPGGLIICEHGYRQAEQVQDIIEEMACYNEIVMRRDYAGRPRVTICRYSPT